jgi:hypothetical protein
MVWGREASRPHNLSQRKNPFQHALKWAQYRAENVGFEPTVPCGTTVFKTAAIDHSANSPRQK